MGWMTTGAGRPTQVWGCAEANAPNLYRGLSHSIRLGRTIGNRPHRCNRFHEPATKS